MNRKSILIEQFILHAENGLITGSDGDLAPEGWDDTGFLLHNMYTTRAAR